MANFAFIYFKARKSRAYISIFVCLLTTSQGKLTLTPTDVNVTEGESVRLKCTTDSGKPVNWQFGKQVNRMRDVYINGEGLVGFYRNLRRYSVEENSTTGKYDLRISNATFDDAGYYICSEPKGKDDPPHARLLVSGMESLTTFCRKDFVIAVVDNKTQLKFSDCKTPFYVSHLPVGEKYFRTVYDKESLINGYADGRFSVQESTGGACLLTIRNTSRLDAGTFTCTDHSGSGVKHAVELVTIVRLPECSANDTNSSLNADPGTQLEARCEVNFVGKCVPLFAWRYQNGSTDGGYVIDPVRTPIQLTDDTVYSAVVVHSSSSREGSSREGSKVTCYIWEPSMRTNSSFQCSLSLESGAEPEESSSKRVSAMVLLALALSLLVMTVIVIIVLLCVRRRQKSTTPTNSLHRMPDDENSQHRPLSGSPSETVSLNKKVNECDP